MIVYSALTAEAPFDPVNAEMQPAQSTVSCITPPLLNHSVAPNTTLVYRYYGAWTPEQQVCVDRAFDTWNQYLTELKIQFVLDLKNKQKTSPTLSVVMTPMPAKIGGAITPVTRRPDGYFRGAGILVSNDNKVVSSCLGYYKVVLHEAGHILGLGHPTEHGKETSVMNDMNGANDQNLALPNAPTTCDIDQVKLASRAPRF